MAAGEGKPISPQMAGVRLEYDGKKPMDQILSCTPLQLCSLTAIHPHDNRLYFADNLGVMAALAHDPQVSGQVRVVYIDPPFATQSSFQSRKLSHAYEDSLSGSEFLEYLRERLVWIHRLLAENGSLYLHLDERMAFHFRVVLDEIFGPTKYRNCIIRKKCNPKNYTRRTFGNVADYILFYTKSDSYVWNRPIEPWTDERAAKEYQYTDPRTGRRYKKVPVHAPSIRNGETGLPWRGVPPPPGKHWQYPPKVLDEMDARGEIYWSPTGNPRRKIYLDSSAGVPLQDMWMDVKDAHNQNIRITGYPTEKNPDLIRRLILASSNPGDLVFDCFAGSGTTLAVASELGRRWIGVDKSPEAIRTTVRRFAHGLEPMGDFVSDRNDAAILINPTLPGFENANVLGSTVHRPIEDYTVYAEPQNSTIAQTLLEPKPAADARRSA